MLEAQSHEQLKTLLRDSDADWPHHLTLSRLVARSLRRRDNTLLQLPPCSRERWWLGLLVPLCLTPGTAALVITAAQRRRLLQVELPRLQRQGLRLPCWQGSQRPPGEQLWLMDTTELVTAFRTDQLGQRQLILPDVDQLSHQLRKSLSVRIHPWDWESLRLSHPQAESALMELHERLTRQLFSNATRVDAHMRLEGAASQTLRDLLRLIAPCPSPWAELLATDLNHWAEWAELNHAMLQWIWHLAPLEPLELLGDLFKRSPLLMLSSSGEITRLDEELRMAGVEMQVTARFREQELQEPLPLFAPRRQPLPNTEIYSQHLLEQSRRLILGRTGLTIVLLDDPSLRRQLTSALAAEFGRRVVEECTAPEGNGVISCSWTWWLENHEQLPAPEQIIVGLLPLASVSSPLTATRVERLKSRGEDWFRVLLLPEALCMIPPALAPLRQAGGRLAILDGRLRGRAWGDQILQRLNPWIPLQRLLPD